MKARIPNFFAFLMLYYFPLHLSATTSFYTTFNSKTFDGPDKQITNSTNPTQRTYSSSVNQKFYASNYSFMVGISDIEILSNKYVDFLISNISSGSSGTTSVGLKVYPYSALNSLTYTAIAAASDSVLLIPINFASHANFASQFTSGTGLRNLTYFISYIPPNPLKFAANVSASLSFYRINATYQDYFCVQTFIHNITDNQVVFSIQTDMTTKFFDLLGTLVLFGSDTLSNTRYGLEFNKISVDTPSSMKTLPASGYAGTFEKIYSKRITRFALPNCFTFLTGWNTTTAPRIMIKTTFGYLPDNTSVASIFYRVSTSTKLYSIGIEVLTSCTDDANCLTFSYAPQVHSGSIASRSDWRGINISQNTSSYRSDSFNIAFGVFFPNVPKYYAVGLTKIQITTDFKNMSLKVNSVQPQSIDFSLSISPYCILENLWLAVLGSDWDGLQYFFIDFANHPQFLSVFQQSKGQRILTYAIPYNPSPEMSIKKTAAIIFTELAYNYTSGNITIKQNFTSSNDTHVFIDLITEDDISWITIKGYVAISTLGPSKTNFEMNMVYSKNHSFLLSTSSLRDDYITVPFNHLYAGSPSILYLITQFKITFTFDKKISLGAQANSIGNGYNSTSYALNLNVDIQVDQGKLYELDILCMAYTGNPTTKPYFLDQQGYGAYANISQNVRLSIPYPQILDYALLIIDQGRFNTNFNIKFNNNEAAPPRIYSAYKFQILNDIFMRVTVLPFELIKTSSTTSTSFVILPLYIGDLWAISIYSTSFQYFTNTAPILDWVGYLDFSTYTYAQRNHSTMIASKLYEVNITVPCSCQVQLSFAGIIRSLYVNSEFLITDSSLSTDNIKIVQTFRRATLEPQKMLVITLIGRSLSVYDLKFVNCTDNQYNPVDVNITSYYASGTNISVTDILYTNTSRCDLTTCFSCKNFTYCYKCQPQYVLYQGLCYTRCPYPLVATNGKFCDITARNSVLRNQIPVFNPIASQVSLNYSVEFVSNNSNVLSMLLPQRIDFAQLPIININNYQYSLAESTQNLTLVYTFQSIASYNSTLKPFITVNQSNEGIIQGYSILSSNYLIATYNSLTFDPTTVLSVSILKNLTNLTLNSNYTYRIQVFLNCLTNCKFIFSLDGNLDFLINYRTSVLSLNYTTYQTYQLMRNLTGFLFITFEITNTTQFNVAITGSYKYYYLNSFLFEEVIYYPPINNCSIQGCQNCANDQTCLSCVKDSFLTLGSRTCSSQCFTQYPYNVPERRCFCSDNVECIFPQASRCDTSQGICVSCLQDSDCTQMATSTSGSTCDSGVCKLCSNNCYKCNATNCLQCLKGFNLIDNNCQCKPGTKLINNICQDMCGDGVRPATASAKTCDDNNTVSGDGCSNICEIENGYACQGGGPFTTDICYQQPNMSMFQASSYPIFIVSFTQPMNFPENLSQIFVVQLQDIPSSSFSYVMKKLTNKTISIEIIPSQSLPISKLTLTAIDPNITKDIYGNTLSNIAFSVNLKSSIKFIDKKTAEITSTLTQIGTVVSTTASATSGVIFLTSFNPAIIWGIVNLFQLFYCLQLINVDYPPNVDTFFSIFSIGRLNMIPNPLASMAELFEKDNLQIPRRFETLGMNGLFLVNSGPMILLWIISFLAYIISIVVSKYIVRVTKMFKVFALKYKQSFEKGGMLQLWIGSFFDISISMFLQFRSANLNSVFRVFSILTACCFMSLIFLIPWREHIHHLSIQRKRKSPLYREFVEYPSFKQNFIFIILARRLAIAATLVFLHDFPRVEIVTLISIHVLPSLVTIFSSPYKKLHLRIVRAVDDGIYFLVHFIVFILVYDNSANILSYNTKIILGWIIIGSSLTCVVINVLIMLHGQIKEIIRFFKLLKHGKIIGRTVIKKRSVKRVTQTFKHAKVLSTLSDDLKILMDKSRY